MAVYFVQAGQGGPIKIGFASEPAKRLPGLQVNNPTRLIPLGQIHGDQATERALHAQFSEFQVSGEWFAPNAELLALIDGATPIYPKFQPPSGRQWTLDEIIELAGGVGKLAEVAEVDHSTISSGWRRTGKIPVERALLIHDKLAVPLHEIRPDIWRPAAPQGCAA